MSRHVFKTGSYAAMHFAVAMAVAFALSGDWLVALGIGIVEPVVQTVAYALHERFWAGKNSDSSAAIA